MEADLQLPRLIGEGCSHIQGYFFGRPQPGTAAKARLAIRRATAERPFGLAHAAGREYYRMGKAGRCSWVGPG
ncbi:hypothetical protein [Pseudomonas huanghezhanensis]|uniref:hypothetical protein n=1 Tax=Pseudomonas huanghezhanensis TaxID=3002903 RepID=UPI002E1BC012